MLEMRLQIKDQCRHWPSSLYLFVLMLAIMYVPLTLRNTVTFMFWLTFFMF